MKMRKVLSMLLAAAMTLSLAACGGGSGSQGGSGSGGASGGLPEVSIMLPGFYGGEMSETRDKDGAVQKAIEDYIGVSPVWRFENSEGYGDKMNMTLMNPNDLPAILTFTGDISTTIIQAAQNGAFWDLSQFINPTDYPNLSQMQDSVKAIFTINGQLIAIPKMRTLGRYGLSYRGDWADKLGFTTPPTTTDELYEMLKAFREQDPDGNGQKDTYGLEVNGSYLGWMDIIYAWFGAGVGWTERDGKLVPVHETPEYKEALDWILKLTQEGIIRPDWASVGTDGWGDATKTGKTGAFIDTLDGGGRRQWRYYIENSIPSVTDTPSPDPDNPDTAWSVMVGALNGATAAVQVYNGGFLITKGGAKTEDDVKNALKFLDKMMDAPMCALATFGIEGVSYHMEDGYAVNDVGDANNLPSQGINQAQCFIPEHPEGEVIAKPDAPGAACTEAQEEAAKYAVINAAMAYLPQSETYVKDGSNIASKITDAAVRYASGVDTWEQFQAAVAEWESLGGAQIKEEVNALYQASNS